MRRGLLHFCLAAFLFAAALGGCGRMGNPIPPEEALLAQPTALIIHGRGGKLSLSWSAPEKTVRGDLAQDIRGYEVEIEEWEPGADSCAACPSTPAKTVFSPTTTFSHASVKPGYAYRYRVIPVDYRGREGTRSQAVSIKWPLTPEPPEILLENAHLGARVRLEYPDPAHFAAANLKPLEVSVLKPDGEPLAAIPYPVVDTVISGLPEGVSVELSFTLKASTPEGWIVAAPSITRKILPRDLLPPLPPPAAAAFPERGGIQVHWMGATGEPATQFIIERAEGEGEFERLTLLPGEALGHLDATVSPGKLYSYRVRPLDKAGNVGGPSATARARALDSK